MPTTPNMELDLPEVSVTIGPDWATALNAALSLIDSHDHTTDKGTLIPVAGIDIQDDVPFNDNLVGLTKGVSFTSQSTALPASGDTLNTFFVLDGDLYFNDGSGNQIPITSLGSVVGNVTLENNEFLTATNNAGTGLVNLIKANTSDEVEVGSGIAFPQPIRMVHNATPSNPAVGSVKWYAKNDNNIYLLDSSGNESLVNQALSRNFSSVATTQTLVTPGYYLCNDSSASFTLTLPSSPNDNDFFAFEKTNSSTNKVTIKNSGGTNIGMLFFNTQFVKFQWDGTIWRVVDAGQRSSAARTTGITFANDGGFATVNRSKWRFLQHDLVYFEFEFDYTGGTGSAADFTVTFTNVPTLSTGYTAAGSRMGSGIINFDSGNHQSVTIAVNAVTTDSVIIRLQETDGTLDWMQGNIPQNGDFVNFQGTYECSFT